jgi:hypothetical protein
VYGVVDSFYFQPATTDTLGGIVSQDPIVENGTAYPVTVGEYGKANVKIPTYSISKNGSTITLTCSDGSTPTTVTDADTHNSHKINSGTKADGTAITSSAASSGDITLGDSGVTAGEYGPTANATPGYGATFNVPDIKVNAKGIVTSITNRTVTMPTKPIDTNTYITGIGVSGNTVSATRSDGQTVSSTISSLKVGSTGSAIASFYKDGNGVVYIG